ncbi:MAG TPA: hypothetical protein EYP61_06925 [Candidatus Latescibacteria bacterium]|nr:hypothetical protein [Candidatus Latescibacterota bacterium]
MRFIYLTMACLALPVVLSCGSTGRIMEDGRIYVENDLPAPTDPRTTNEAVVTYFDEDLSREVTMIVPPEGGRKALGSECPEYGSEGKLFKGGTEVTVHIRTKTTGEAEEDIVVTVDGNRTIRIVRMAYQSGSFEYEVR